MKKITLTVAALLAFAVSAFAQKTPTPVVVDMGQLINGYYKTNEAQLRINSAQQTANAELEKQANELRALESQIKEKGATLGNPALTDEGKKKIEAEIKPMVEKLNANVEAFQQARQQAANDLQQRSSNVRATLVKEITEKAVEIAKQKNADMVLTLNAGVLWADSAYDITKEVLEALNASQVKK